MITGVSGSKEEGGGSSLSRLEGWDSSGNTEVLVRCGARRGKKMQRGSMEAVRERIEITAAMVVRWEAGAELI